MSKRGLITEFFALILIVGILGLFFIAGKMATTFEKEQGGLVVLDEDDVKIADMFEYASYYAGVAKVKSLVAEGEKFSVAVDRVGLDELRRAMRDGSSVSDERVDRGSLIEESGGVACLERPSQVVNSFCTLSNSESVYVGEGEIVNLDKGSCSAAVALMGGTLNVKEGAVVYSALTIQDGGVINIEKGAIVNSFVGSYIDGDADVINVFGFDFDSEEKVVGYGMYEGVINIEKGACVRSHVGTAMRGGVINIEEDAVVRDVGYMMNGEDAVINIDGATVSLGVGAGMVSGTINLEGDVKFVTEDNRLSVIGMGMQGGVINIGEGVEFDSDSCIGDRMRGGVINIDSSVDFRECDTKEGGTINIV